MKTLRNHLRYCLLSFILVAFTGIYPHSLKGATNKTNPSWQSSKQDSAKVDSTQPAKVDPWFGRDKYTHLAASAFLVAGQMYFYRHHLNMSDAKAVSISIAVTGGIGVGKEIYDGLSQKGTASLRDMLANLVGLAVGSLIFILH